MLESHLFDSGVSLPERLAALTELALNLRWTWDRSARALFRQIYPALWDQIVDNPWLVLQATSMRRLEELAGNPEFCARLDVEQSDLQRYMADPAWFQQAHPDEKGALIAYFTAECGLTEALPIYAGGLGILSGDHLKAASALGIPLVGVSLLYQEGFSRQMLDTSGWQLDRFPSNDFRSMPLRTVRNTEGGPLIVEVPLPGRAVSLLVWRAQVGRVSLYLLDANIPINSPSDRGITNQLYGGDEEIRLLQEMVLGIGGWRALTALGLRPHVCHLNEGHAAFAILERSRSLMEETGTTFWEALAAASAGNVFTTHTPVPAGFDRFAPDLIVRYLTPYAAELRISLQDLLNLGRTEPFNAAEPFRMAVLAVRNVNACNGVSQLHAQTSRRLFRPMFPRFPDLEIPIAAVTNGIHTDSWMVEGKSQLLNRYVGMDADEQPERAPWERVMDIPDSELWECRIHCRNRLVEFARERLRRQLGQGGISAEQAARSAEQVLDPGILTLGFARRFAAYKRANLFMHDPDRLRRLLLDPQRPIQLVIAGKAHPHDQEGKLLLQQVFRFAQAEDVRHRIVVLEDYDMRVTGRMVQGVDVWLNTPRRPLEASGTSGMKVLPNGGLNLSVLDGWWAEAYDPAVGWAFGSEVEGVSDEEQDALDSVQFYETLEREVIPLYYDRGSDGIPHRWMAKVKQSMQTLCPRYNTNRMVREYMEQYYLPAARRYRALTAENLARAKRLAEWKATVRKHWAEVRIEQTSVQQESGGFRFQTRVHLGMLKPEHVAVQLYAEPLVGSSPEIVPMALKSAENAACRYETVVPAHRPPGDFTVRLLPYHPDANQPLDVPLMLWEH